MTIEEICLETALVYHDERQLFYAAPGWTPVDWFMVDGWTQEQVEREIERRSSEETS